MHRATKGCLSPQEWTEWMDGTVNSLTHQVYQKHIDRCDTCRQKYASLSLAIDSLKDLRLKDAERAPTLYLKVKKRLAWEQGHGTRRRIRVWWMPIAVGVLIVSLGLLTGRPNLSGKAQSYVDLYAEMYLQAEGLVGDDFSPLGTGRGANLW